MTRMIRVINKIRVRKKNNIKWCADKKSQFVAILFLLIEKKVVLLQRKSQYIGIMDLKEIGQIIRERRAVLGVNQRTVSELSGVAVNTLVAIERGEGNPQITTLLDILETIGLQLEVKPKVMEYETR